MNRISTLRMVLVYLAAAIPAAMAQPILVPQKPLPSWAPDPACMKELESAAPRTPKCQQQVDKALIRMREETDKCSAAMQKISDGCGPLSKMSDACYKKHQPGLETACGGR
jgi:hypothetical protein